jgi:hypothetical protein
MTEDKRYFFGTEEFNEVDITVWDLQDRSTWGLAVASWETASNATVHNLFIKGTRAHISYYSDGYVVLDISDPENPVLIGQYDTSSMWGCYPYLPSGITLCSDIDDGLYVFQFNDPVPVELSSFTAIPKGKDVLLNWTTTTETNNLGFEIQRKDGNWYHTIGFVEGNGTTTEIQNYSFSNRNLQTGTYFYRLKQVDYDGSSEYSDEVMVDVSPGEFSLDQNYPNPFNPATKIEFNLANNGLVSLKIYDMIGTEVSTLVNEYRPAGNYEVTFNASDLPSGIYLAKLSSGDFVQTIKMSLIK